MNRSRITWAACVLILLPACVPPGSNNCGDSTDAGATDTFVGAVDQSRALIALDITHCPNEHARVFLTDGAPDGDSEYFEGSVTNGALELTSKSGQARITAQVTGDGAAGTVTLADGTGHDFSVLPAVDGAGLYEVVIDAQGAWSGTSRNGARLDAEQFNKLVLGVLTDASGQQIEFEVRDMSRIFTEPALADAPDAYLVIALPQGDALLGRGGAENLKTGQANASTNFVRLDLTGSDPTPGTFFGRFQDLPDLIGIQISDLDSDGNRRMRILVSDGRSAPDGRTEWFSGSFEGDFPDASFALDSISGAARIANLELTNPPTATGKEQVHERHDCYCGWPCRCDSGISGNLELADGTIHEFYLVPAGDGAGLYEVQMSIDGMSGNSVSGDRLHLHVDQGQVTGTLTTPNGITTAYSARDLGQAFADPGKLASVSDTFVVLAVPGARFIVGSPGTLEGSVTIADVAVNIGQLPLQ